MTSDTREAFVWIWLPGETSPVVAGRLEADSGNVQFNYGKNYLERVFDSRPAMAVYEPKLPLRRGVLPLVDGLTSRAVFATLLLMPGADESSSTRRSD